MFDVSAGAAGSLPSQMPSEPARHHARDEKPELPPSLAVLLTLPGVPAGLFDGVNTDTAWVRVHQTGCDLTLPLAHLAPDAIETLAELGFTGQVRAELRQAEKGPVVRYFAFRLPEAPRTPWRAWPTPWRKWPTGRRRRRRARPDLTCQVSTRCWGLCPR